MAALGSSGDPASIAQYKRAHGLPVLDAGREREKLADVIDAMIEEAISGEEVIWCS